MQLGRSGCGADLEYALEHVSLRPTGAFVQQRWLAGYVSHETRH